MAHNVFLTRVGFPIQKLATTCQVIFAFVQPPVEIPSLTVQEFLAVVGCEVVKLVNTLLNFLAYVVGPVEPCAIWTVRPVFALVCRPIQILVVALHIVLTLILLSVEEFVRALDELLTLVGCLAEKLIWVTLLDRDAVVRNSVQDQTNLALLELLALILFLVQVQLCSLTISKILTSVVNCIVKLFR